MYRIPRMNEILEIWGSQYYPYRQDSHFETSIYTLNNGTEYVHVQFWRNYDYAPDSQDYGSSNEWKPFTQSLKGKANNLVYDDSLCFISIAFHGGQYPYTWTKAENNLPGFYIDTQRSTNIHCYKLDDIKRDCEQDWSFLTQTADESTDDTDANNSAIRYIEVGEDDETLQDAEDDEELTTNSHNSKPFISGS